jgi:signal transduction histidine kinase
MDFIAQELRSLVHASERPDGPSFGVHAPPSLMARVDPKRLRQMVRNLIANAVAALPSDGHVTVSAVEAGPSSRFASLMMVPAFLPSICRMCSIGTTGSPIAEVGPAELGSGSPS